MAFQLALSYRLLDHLQLNEGACNHLSVLAPARSGKSGQRVMLLGPGAYPNYSRIWETLGQSYQKFQNDL